MSPTVTTYDHAGAVAELLAGYYRAEMADRLDDTSSFELKELQAGRARDEREQARDAEQPAEQQAHQRRAEKADYLREKLAEAEKADREG
jgi:hypothetical protein